MEKKLRGAATAAAVLLTVFAGGTRQAGAQEGSVGAALRSLGQRAGAVFAGEVVDIRHTGSVVEIEFRVDQPLKGAAAGSYVLREWGGLWAAGQRRFWVGERALVFAHAPGRSGVSSPVDGMDGVLPISSADDAEGTPVAHTERLATRVVRAVGEPLPAAPALKLVDVAKIALAVDGEDGIVRLPVRQAPLTPVRVAQPAPARAAAPSGSDEPAALWESHRTAEMRDVLR